MYIQITNRCNMSCAHCCFDCTSKGKDMTLTTFKKAIALMDDVGEVNIEIGGGEPTLHKKFWEIIGLSLSYMHIESVWLATNGSITDIALALANLARKKILSVDLSIDAYHDEISDRVKKAFGYPDYRYLSRASYVDKYGWVSIRDVTGNEMPKGRALKNKLITRRDKAECACDALFIDPYGKIWSCGCKAHSFGTVDNYNIDYETIVGENYDTKCINEHKAGFVGY